MTPLTVIPVPGGNTEDVLVDPEGLIYTGTEDGSVLRIDPQSRRIERVGQTGGRPLGLEMLPDGRILVCDARLGLLAMETSTGKVEVLTSLVNGAPMQFCNNAAVHSGGDIFFSDTSRFYGVDRWKADMIENTASGRLLRRGAGGDVEVLLEGLRFANGVALSADESYVVVAETAGRTLMRRWLRGPHAGEVDQFAGDLPGYPDNIARGSDGLIWVAIASPKDRLVEALMSGPMLARRLAWRLPAALQPKTKRTARVMAFDDTGWRLLRSTWSPACASITAECGWPASRSRPSPPSTLPDLHR